MTEILMELVTLIYKILVYYSIYYVHLNKNNSCHLRGKQYKLSPPSKLLLKSCENLKIMLLLVPTSSLSRLDPAKYPWLFLGQLKLLLPIFSKGVDGLQYNLWKRRIRINLQQVIEEKNPYFSNKDIKELYECGR